jgi:hypothetical protein
MPIGDWIREANQRRRERWRREDRAREFARDFSKVYEKAFQDGYLAAITEAYNLGFVDAEAKKPYRLPDIQRTNPHPDPCPVCGASASRPSTARLDSSS